MTNPHPPTMGHPKQGAGSGRRALGLFVLVLGLSSVARPMVLVAVPFLLLLLAGGIRGGSAFLAAVLATWIVVGGVRDGTWLMERAWAVTAGGLFVTLGLLRPDSRLTSRALGAVGGAVAMLGGFMLVRAGAWEVFDWAMRDRFIAAYATWVDLLTVMRQGEPVAPAVSSVIYRTIEIQMQVYPALVALQSAAAMSVAWWLYRKFTAAGGSVLGRLQDFRFNDHLVWLMIAGLVLVVVRPGEGFARLGANLSVFMGALYAMRGFGVGAFVNGGPGLVGYTLLIIGFLFAAPVVIGFAVLFGIADTWLDLRARVGSVAH